MNKDRIRDIADDLRATIKSFGERNGLTMNVGTIRYGAMGFRVNITGSEPDAARVKFNVNAFVFGLDPLDFGREFTFGGRKLVVTGINPRARRFPIMAVDACGKTWKLGPTAVKSIVAARTAVPS